MTSPTLWRVPVVSVKEWIGPLTAEAFGTPVTNFQVAFTAAADALTDDSWETPVPQPDSLIDGVGILVGENTDHPLTTGTVYAVSVQLVLGQSEPVLKRVGMVVGI